MEPEEMIPKEIIEFLDGMRDRTLGMIEDARTFEVNMDEHERAVFDNVAREASASIFGVVCLSMPSIIGIADELMMASKLIFWIGYHLGSKRTEVPEVFRKAMGGE